MSHCKNSIRDTVIDKRWIYLDSERSTLHRVWAFTEANAVTMDVVWLGFASWVNSYASEWEDHPNYWGTTHPSVFGQSALQLSCHFWVCHLAYRLGIKV